MTCIEEHVIVKCKAVIKWLLELLFLIFHFSVHRYYKSSVVVMCFLIPTFVPWFFWNESLLTSYLVPCLLRYTVSLNATWLVNSAAHMWGMRPYDHNINPRENKFVAFSAIGKNNVFSFTA